MTPTNLVQLCLDDPRRFTWLLGLCTPEGAAPSPCDASDPAVAAACAEILQSAGIAVPPPDPVPALTRFVIRRAAVEWIAANLQQRAADIVVDLERFKPPTHAIAEVRELEQRLSQQRDRHAAQQRRADRQDDAAEDDAEEDDRDASDAVPDERLVLRLEVLAEFFEQQRTKLLRDVHARPRSKVEFEFHGWPQYRAYLRGFYFGVPETGQKGAYQRAVRLALGERDLGDRRPVVRLPSEPAAPADEGLSEAVRMDFAAALAWLDDLAAKTLPGADHRALALYSAFWHAAIQTEEHALGLLRCSLLDVATFGWPGLAYQCTATKSGRDDLFGLPLADLCALPGGLATSVTTSKGTQAVLLADVHAANGVVAHVLGARARSSDELALAAATARRVDAARTAFVAATGAPLARYDTHGADLPAGVLAEHRERLRQVREALIDDPRVTIVPVGELQPWFAASEHTASPTARGDQLVTFAWSAKRRLRNVLPPEVARAGTRLQAPLWRTLLVPLGLTPDHTTEAMES